MFLEFELADGKVKRVVFERSGQPKATLLPKKDLQEGSYDKR